MNGCEKAADGTGVAIYRNQLPLFKSPHDLEKPTEIPSWLAFFLPKMVLIITYRFRLHHANHLEMKSLICKLFRHHMLHLLKSDKEKTLDYQYFS